MMTANEANRKTLSNLSEKIYKAQEALELQIEKAISEGQFSINGVGVLPNSIIQKLRELGYTVNVYSHYNEDGYTISWR